MELGRIRRWPVWSLPPAALSLAMTVEALALVFIGLDVIALPGDAIVESAPRGLVLLVIAIAYAELSRRTERARRRLNSSNHVDMSSIWIAAAAVALPISAAVATTALIRSHLYVRVGRHANVPIFKEVYSSATVVLAVHASFTAREQFAAGGAASAVTIAVSLLAGLLAFLAVNTGLIAAVTLLSGTVTLPQIASGRSGFVLEVVTLALGLLLGLVVVASSPVLVVLAVPFVLLLHQGVLAREVARASP